MKNNTSDIDYKTSGIHISGQCWSGLLFAWPIIDLGSARKAMHSESCVNKLHRNNFVSLFWSAHPSVKSWLILIVFPKMAALNNLSHYIFHEDSRMLSQRFSRKFLRSFCVSFWVFNVWKRFSIILCLRLQWPLLRWCRSVVLVGRWVGW